MGTLRNKKCGCQKVKNKDTCIPPSRDTIKTFGSEFLNACIPVKMFLLDSLLWGGGGGRVAVGRRKYRFVYVHLNHDFTGLRFECPDCSKPFTFVHL